MREVGKLREEGRREASGSGEYPAIGIGQRHRHVGDAPDNPRAAQSRSMSAPPPGTPAPALLHPITQAHVPPTPHDTWVHTPHGRLFTRRWTPGPTASGASSSGTALPPILLFHDSLGCVELWRDFPSALCAATGRDVIAYDRLGFGRSDARTAPMPLDFIGEEALASLPALRAQLGFAGFAALGHSVGGAMAAHCAADGGTGRGTRTGSAGSAGCEALVTVAAQACVEERTLEGIRAARDQFHRSPEALQRLARYHGGDEARARWVLGAWIDTWLHPDFAHWSQAGVLARVHCPVLALHGDQDEYGSTEQPERIARWAAGPARVEILPGAAHVPHRERPQDLAQRVARFLADLQ